TVVTVTIAHATAIVRAMRTGLIRTRPEFAGEPSDDGANRIDVIAAARQKGVQPASLNLRVELRQCLHFLARDSLDVRLLVNRPLVEHPGDRFVADVPRDTSPRQLLRDAAPRLSGADCLGARELARVVRVIEQPCPTKPLDRGVDVGGRLALSDQRP